MIRRPQITSLIRLLPLIVIFGCLAVMSRSSHPAATPSAMANDDDIEIQDRDSQNLEADPLEEVLMSFPEVNNSAAVQLSDIQHSRRIIEQKSSRDTTTVNSTEGTSRDPIQKGNYPRLKRLLITVSDYYDTVFIQLPQFIQVSNIFIVAAMLTNNFELLLPVIEYTQMFFFLGFFNILKGRLDQFFVGFNSGKIDPYRLLAAMFPFKFDPAPGLPPTITNAGLNSSILSNLIPDIALIIIASLVYLASKLLTVCTKSELLRKINFAFKSIWNGLVYVESMRFCFFIGLQSRFLQVESFLNIMELVLMGATAAVVIGYPVKLALDIKGFIEDRENTQLMTSIGLIEDIDHDKRFEFDCLRYSNMYYPVMNYVRHVIFFTSIGAAFDITKVQIGGPIVALFLYFTIFFNEPPHRDRRNNATNFISNLIILLLICCKVYCYLGFISIDIAETISHPEVSTPICFAVLCLYLLGLVVHVFMILVAIIIKLANRKKAKAEEGMNTIVKEHLEEAKREEKARFKRGNNTTDNEKAIFGITSNSERSNVSAAEDEKPKEKFEAAPVRVKKVKNARII